jgi:hypothetical protein
VRRKRKPHATGGSVRHPNSLANLRPNLPAPEGNLQVPGEGPSAHTYSISGSAHSAEL